jgi:predicted permease
MDEEIVTEYPLFDERWKSFLLTSSTITKNFNDNSSEDQARAIIWIIILGIIIITIVAAAIYFIFRVVKKETSNTINNINTSEGFVNISLSEL